MSSRMTSRSIGDCAVSDIHDSVSYSVAPGEMEKL